MLVVAGLSLKNLKPRVWDLGSPYYLPSLSAVMVSYADFDRMPASRRAAMAQGLHAYLGIPAGVQIYLDNGAFYFLGRTGEIPRMAYEEFVVLARPDWYPIPQDFIPAPKMPVSDQQQCFARTMISNLSYQHDGFVPVIHIGPFLEQYAEAIQTNPRLGQKSEIALGGIVPNLLRAPKALPYTRILDSLYFVRQTFQNKQLHVFGIGGTATLHLAALLQIDSADSSGWRNRAARGIIQLPGSGDRAVVNMGSWRGRGPSQAEWRLVLACPCPACQQFGAEGLKAGGLLGFCNRATHNLWVLLDETRLIAEHLVDGTYDPWYTEHIDNSIYLPLIRHVMAKRLSSSGIH